jgi:hypothetical protein
LFSENIQIYNPKIKTVLPELNSEIIENKKDLEHYWSIALNKFNNIHFTPKGYFIKIMFVFWNILLPLMEKPSF